MENTAENGKYSKFKEDSAEERNILPMFTEPIIQAIHSITEIKRLLPKPSNDLEIKAKNRNDILADL